MRLYIAGKVSIDSVFGTHRWRDNFVRELAELSGRELSQIDPMEYWSSGAKKYNAQDLFDECCNSISEADCAIVYLSDDISVGGSQEMLIAKYLKKPLVGLAPYGGKFYAAEKEFMGQTIKDYVDPFVYATCDVVCRDVNEVAKALENVQGINAKTITVIDSAIERAVALGR